MKKLFKLGFLALAVSLSVAACNSSNTSEADSDTTVIDSPAVDTTVLDSTGVDTLSADTAAQM
jgi:hypothetical protein